MAIDRNAIVPIPEEANHPKMPGRRVFIVTKKNYDPEKKYNSDERISIGESINDRLMYPNDSYKTFFPQLFNENAPHEKKIPDLTKIIGPFAAFLAVGQHTQLYSVLIKSFGPLHANMIMDYAMYSILEHSNVAKDFKATMQKHLLFSNKAYSDTWLSEFFSTKLTDEQGKAFRDNWIETCKEKGVARAWICIDGSNNDCDAENVITAENGCDKSGSGGPIVSYMWAVSSSDGTPLTYLCYRGSRVDSVAVKEMVAYLDAFGIKTDGVILDRGFWNIDDVRCLRAAGLDFLIMMKDGHGFSQMLEKHGATLRSECVGNMLQRTGEYGIIDKVQLFKDMPDEYNVCLLYNNIQAVKAVNRLTDKVKAAIRDAKSDIAGNKPYTISSDVKSYITVTKYRGRKKDTVEQNDLELQKAVNQLGFAALATSKPLTAQEVDDIYALRQHSEKQYAAFKTQLGYDVLRVYSSGSWHSKFACGFAAGILRNDFENRCAKAGTDANAALKELCFVAMGWLKEKIYLYIRLMPIKAKAVLAECGLVESDMDLIVQAENARLDGTAVHPIHELPVRTTVKRGPGRPKGSKNKKGTKPKKTTESKRGPGRPKGSKNKKTSDSKNAEKYGENVTKAPGENGKPT